MKRNIPSVRLAVLNCPCSKQSLQVSAGVNVWESVEKVTITQHNADVLPSVDLVAASTVTPDFDLDPLSSFMSRKVSNTVWIIGKQNAWKM